MGLRRKKGRHNMTHKIRRIATTRSLLRLTACVGPLTQWGEEISLVTRASSFDPSVLEDEQVAVLSAVVGFGLEGYSLQVSRSLSVALAESERPIQVIPVQEALSQLNRGRAWRPNMRQWCPNTPKVAS